MRFLGRFTLIAVVAVGCGKTALLELDPVEPPPDPIDVDCGPLELSAEVGNADAAWAEPWRGPLASEQGLYLSRQGTASTNSPDDFEVFRLDLSTQGEEQLTANDINDFVVDANDGAYLFLRGADPRGDFELRYRDESGNEALLASEVDGYSALSGDFTGGKVRLVANGRAAWRDTRRDAVLFYESAEVTEVSSGLRFNTWPNLEGGFITWTGSDGTDMEVYLASRDGTIQISDNDTHDTSPLLMSSRVYWLNEGRVLSRSVRDDDTTVIHEGPCAPPHAEGGRVVFACADPDDESFPSPGRRLFVYDGQALTQISVAEGFIYAPRIHNDRVAWLQYRDEADLCSAPTNEPGRVMVVSLDSPENPLEVARVGLPCLCCGAFWPPPWLDLDGDILAWNYALIEEESPPERRFGAGFALLSGRRHCD